MKRPNASVARVALALAAAMLVALIGSPADSRAAVPGQNGRIAFQLDAGGRSGIAVVNADGFGVRALTDLPVPSGAPAWSPDGTRIAFTETLPSLSGPGHPQIRLLDFFTGDVTPLFPSSGGIQPLFEDSTPAWSPDGTKVAFTRCTISPVDCDVWVAGADGSGAVNLTQLPASDDRSPAWSPDGTKIAFSSSREGNPDIFVMNADGTAPTRLTDTPEADDAPDWSPDGTKLIFARHATIDTSAIWSMNADGTSPVSLGDGDQPAFSPDGTAIAFTRTTAGNKGLFKMNPDGTGAAALLDSPDGESDPSWQPINAGANVPPVADAGLDATFTCESAETAARLDGSLSTDADSTPGTNDDIRLFEWWIDFGLATEEFLGTGPTMDQLGLASGTYLVTLQVTDSKGQTDTDDVSITINDQTPPDVSVQLRPSRIWPPNHRMVRAHAVFEAFDFCGPAPVVLKSVTSNEPDNGTGDGNFSPDIQGADTDTPDGEFFLRAERSGNGSGRIYTATYEATDPSGNIGTGSGQAIVPHDRGRGNSSGPGSPPTAPGKGKGKGKGNGHNNGNGHGNGNGNGNGNGPH